MAVSGELVSAFWYIHAVGPCGPSRQVRENFRSDMCRSVNATHYYYTMNALHWGWAPLRSHSVHWKRREVAPLEDGIVILLSIVYGSVRDVCTNTLSPLYVTHPRHLPGRLHSRSIRLRFLCGTLVYMINRIFVRCSLSWSF